MQRDVGELGSPVDGEKHVHLALSRAELAGINVRVLVHVADLRLSGVPAFGCVLWARWETADPVTQETAMERAAGELGQLLP